MAKEMFSFEGKWYFVDDESGEIYEVQRSAVINPKPELVREALKAHHELKKSKGE